MNTATDTPQALALLGDSGFIFLDARKLPYAIRLEGNGEWWLYYYNHSYRGFASLRAITDAELNTFRASALPAHEAEQYLNGSNQ